MIVKCRMNVVMSGISVSYGVFGCCAPTITSGYGSRCVHVRASSFRVKRVEYS